MEENIRSLLAQECFYFRTSLNWTVESGVTLEGFCFRRGK